MTAANAGNPLLVYTYSVHHATARQYVSTDHVGGRQPFCVKALRDLRMCACVHVWVSMEHSSPQNFALCGLGVHTDVPSIFKQQNVFRYAGCLSRYQMLFT